MFVDLWICGKLCMIFSEPYFFESFPQAPQKLLLQKDLPFIYAISLYMIPLKPLYNAVVFPVSNKLEQL
jgi:hypothetical protein